MKRIPVLWLVEHVAREMDVATAVAHLARTRHGMDLTIRNVFLHANEVMRTYDPDVVVHPFFYFVAGSLVTEDYVRMWPQAVHFNLAWEQIFYKAHLLIKAPSDEFAQKTVLHHAWGPFYRDYLLGHGVPDEHIVLNGNPMYQLYFPPYNRRYLSRDLLARRYALDPALRWVFVPENYSWAFISDSKIATYTRLGSDPGEMRAMVEFCRASLADVLRWCNAAARGDVEIIFRPRLNTSAAKMLGFFTKHVGVPAPHLHLIKGESVRDWIPASDAVMSSYSTSLIEAAVADRPIYMVEPVPIPEALHAAWYRFVPRLRTQGEFDAACAHPQRADGPVGLKAWAMREMLPRDPIRGLADRLADLVQRSPRRPTRVAPGTWVRGMRRRLRVGKKSYFTAETHENDVFAEPDVQRQVRQWATILDPDVS